VTSADPRAVATLEAHLAYLRALTIAGGGEVIERHAFLIYAGTFPLPFLINGAARTDPRADPSAVVAEALAYFGGRGFEIVVLERRDEDLATAAERAGLVPVSPDPVQYLDRRPTHGAADRSSLRIRTVNDEAGVSDVVSVNEDAHAVYEFPNGLFSSIFANPATVLSAAVHAIVVYDHDVPVATAQIFRHGDLAYVGWVSVARAAGRRGLGWLVTEEVVNFGFDHGATAAVLMASPMGAPLYRKMGFVDVGALRNVFARPATRPEAP
jgi:ribosomal protein S18 acetylase RimI-like enzyme